MATMLWLVAVSELSVQLATPAVEGATAVQLLMSLPLSMNLTLPARVIPPEGIGMLAVKVTTSFTVEALLVDEVSVMFAVAAVMACDTVLLLVMKFGSVGVLLLLKDAVMV